MARQQQNRVNPDTVESFQIKPSANVVNKLSQYQVDMSDINKSKATAQGLATLGQGIMDTAPMLKDMSQKAVANAQALAKNKSDWAEVSRNIKGLAKFNPFNYSTFQELTARDLTQAYVQNLYKDPELPMRTTAEVNQMIEVQKQDLLNTYKSMNIPTFNYIDYFQKFEQEANEVQNRHISQQAEFTYKMTNNKIQQSYGGQLVTTPQGVDKSVHFNNVLNGVVIEGQALGRTAYSNAENILGTVRNAIYTDPSKYSSAYVLEQLRGYTIDGKTLQELIPDFDAQVLKLVREAKQADYQDRHLEVQSQELQLKINSKQATKDFFEFYKANPNASPSDLYNQSMNLVNQYGLEEVGFSFLGEVVKDRNIITSMKTVMTDPEIMQELTAKAAMGTLDSEEVGTAILAGQLNADDGIKLMDRLNREAKAEVQALKSDYTTLTQKFKKNGVYGQSFKTSQKDLKDFENKINQIIIEANNGTITAEEARAKLVEIDRKAAAIAKLSQSKATNDSFLLNANYIQAQNTPKYNAQEAQKAFSQLGLLRGSVGQKVKTDITSAPVSTRTVKGQTKAHKGYDLAATTQTNINNCSMGGKVISAGYLNDFGNYIVIKYDNGSYARFGHLSTKTGHLNGKRVNPYDSLGKAGSTGFSTGVHLHVDFWDKNRQLISVEQFAKGIK